MICGCLNLNTCWLIKPSNCWGQSQDFTHLRIFKCLPWLFYIDFQHASLSRETYESLLKHCHLPATKKWSTDGLGSKTHLSRIPEVPWFFCKHKRPFEMMDLEEKSNLWTSCLLPCGWWIVSQHLHCAAGEPKEPQLKWSLAKVRKITVFETLRKVSGISNSMGIMGTLFWPRFFALVFLHFWGFSRLHNSCSESCLGWTHDMVWSRLGQLLGELPRGMVFCIE